MSILIPVLAGKGFCAPDKLVWQAGSGPGKAGPIKSKLGPCYKSEYVQTIHTRKIQSVLKKKQVIPFKAEQ